jgi:hypothetical protein
MAPMPAKKPAATPPAADDDADPATMGDADDAAGDDDGAEEEGGPTIMDNHDGTYTLIHGDEPEEGGEEGEGAEGGEEGGESEGGPEGEEGTDNAAGGEEGGEEEGPMQEHFDEPNELLHAVLKLLESAEEANGSGEHAFSAGFDADHNPTPKK